MSTISLIFLVWMALLTIPVFVFLLEVALGKDAERLQKATEAAPPFAVLMPAHNEGAGIASVLTALRTQLRAEDRLLVVADNCNDDTAAIARSHGAEVIERHDPVRRGKGFALDFGVRHLALQPPASVIVVDADCQVEAGSLELLAAQSVTLRRPVQALYLMKSASTGIASRFAEFAWRVKNQTRPQGLHRAGLPCQLMGTGMAFPWSLISAAPLASGHIVEDLQLGLDLAMNGAAPVFCPHALVTSQFAANAEGAESQRTRWEHGHLQLIVSRVPALFLSSLRRRRLDALTLALDLLVPPLALLALLVGATCVAGVAIALFDIGYLWMAVTAGGLLALLASGVVVAWHRHGRDLLTAKDLAGAPLYAMRKLPLYARFLIARQVSWVRAKRDE
jgi:cellulose synthase/poly-beta-1,6-N-acetylglucosamine synthase-like glycosyltransferase